MKVLISGSSGLIGSALVAHLKSLQHEVFKLVRSQPKSPDEIKWDPASGAIDASQLEGFDAVVNLAGESIAERWTAQRKAAIASSRIEGTRLLCRALAALTNPPGVLINGSAIGYYGDRGSEALKEESPPGTGFLAGVCREWEDATSQAAGKGIRVVMLRTGVVLSTKGGALAKMLLPFQMGAGGPLGSGNQYLSFIAIDDLVAVIEHVLTTDTISGPVNAVGPRPVTNLEFSKALGRALSRPAVCPAPASMVRLLLGEMADELLLASARVEPAKLLASGFTFKHPEIEEALRHVLDRG